VRWKQKFAITLLTALNIINKSFAAERITYR
jgi:hypothetical protein